MGIPGRGFDQQADYWDCCRLTSKQIIGIVVGGIGAVLVQVHLKANKKKSAGGIPAQTEVS